MLLHWWIRTGLDWWFSKICESGLDRIQFYRIRTGLGLKNFTVCSSLQHSGRGHSSNDLEPLTDLTFRQALNQLGSPGGTKSFPRGAQMFLTMSNIFKLCPTHFSSRCEYFSRGSFAPPGHGPSFRAPFSDFRKLNVLLTVLSERHFRISQRFPFFPRNNRRGGLTSGLA